MKGLISEDEKSEEKPADSPENIIAKPLGARIPVVKNEEILILLILNVIYEIYDKLRLTSFIFKRNIGVLTRI
jgi:hypothetical protein